MTEYVFKSKRQKAGKVRSSEHWYGAYRLDGESKETRVCLGTTDKQVAREKLRRVVLELQRQSVGLVPSTELQNGAQRSLGEHLGAFLADLRAKRRDEKYLYNLEKRINRLCLECAWTHARDVAPGRFLAWRAEQKKAAKTLNEYLDAISALLNWLELHGQIAVNPLAKVERVNTNGAQVRTRRALTDEEMRRLLGVAGPRKAAYLAAVWTGLRRAELGSLQWGDIHLEAKPPYFKARASTTKNAKDVVMTVHAELAAELARMKKAEQGGGEPVFADGLPSMPQLRADLEAAGIPFVDGQGRRADFHALRYTLNTRMALGGVQLRVRQEVMRHSDPKLTDKTYLDASQLPTTAAIDCLSAFGEAVADTVINTVVPVPGGPGGSSLGTGRGNDMAAESLDNEGDCHVLASSGAACHSGETGSKGRTRTYKTNTCLSRPVFAGTEDHNRLAKVCSMTATPIRPSRFWPSSLIPRPSQTRSCPHSLLLLRHSSSPLPLANRQLPQRPANLFSGRSARPSTTSAPFTIPPRPHRSPPFAFIGSCPPSRPPSCPPEL